MIDVLRRSRMLRLPGNQTRGLEKGRALPREDCEHLHAEALLQDDGAKRAAVLLGPEHSTIGAALVGEAHREAYNTSFDGSTFSAHMIWNWRSCWVGAWSPASGSTWPAPKASPYRPASTGGWR